MTLFILAYLAGLLTIATPCIFPVLPFILARANQPFRRGGLPLLLGLAVAFAAVASLASVAGGWAVEANHYGRLAALALMTLFGLTMLMPAVAERMSAPLVAVGSRLANWAGSPANADSPMAAVITDRDATAGSSVLLGIATGLVWAPCAGPVLGLILTGAALRGPGTETSLLLLTYGLGAATSLSAGMLFGRRLLALVRPSLRWADGLRQLLGVAVVAGAAVIWLGLDTGLLTRLSSDGTNSVEQRLIAALRSEPKSATASRDALFGPQSWLNTPPLQLGDLRGKVVLVNFWTYSCVNCLRVLPHVRAWADTYKDRGLIVIGVHTPEYAFEKDVAKVRDAVTALGISHPVVIDNDYSIWRTFDNRAWPALYFIGADGRIEHQVLGEGRYDQSERLIQRLLSEADNSSLPSSR